MKLSEDWIIGFVDGEGCFRVSILRHPETNTGYQVLPEFTVVQHEQDKQILYALKSYFKCGVVRKNHSDRWCYRIRKLSCLKTLCNFFNKHPLKTKKNVDYIKFRRIIQDMIQRKHLTREGLEKIIKTAITMNTADKKKFLQIKQNLGIK